MPRKTRKQKLRAHHKPTEKMAAMPTSDSQNVSKTPVTIKKQVPVSTADTQATRETIRDIFKTLVLIAALLGLQAAVYYAQTHGMLARFFN